VAHPRPPWSLCSPCYPGSPRLRPSGRARFAGAVGNQAHPRARPRSARRRMRQNRAMARATWASGRASWSPARGLTRGAPRAADGSSAASSRARSPRRWPRPRLGRSPRDRAGQQQARSCLASSLEGVNAIAPEVHLYHVGKIQTRDVRREAQRGEGINAGFTGGSALLRRDWSGPGDPQPSLRGRPRSRRTPLRHSPTSPSPRTLPVEPFKGRSLTADPGDSSRRFATSLRSSPLVLLWPVEIDGPLILTDRLREVVLSRASTRPRGGASPEEKRVEWTRGRTKGFPRSPMARWLRRPSAHSGDAARQEA